MKYGLISVSDKSGVEMAAKEIGLAGFRLMATSGTADYLRKKGFDVIQVSDITGMTEKRELKTLHPKIIEMIHSGEIAVVVVSLYPFSSQPSVDNIDIGGVTLLRAASKNYEKVAAIPSRDFYHLIRHAVRDVGVRRMLAVKTFELTSEYDAAIARWLSDVVE